MRPICWDDIAKVEAYEKMDVDYQDLCDPYQLEEDEEIFYGFWGSCANAYRDTSHHRGYQILRNWRATICSKASGNSGSSQEEKRAAFRAVFERLSKCDALPADVTADSVTNDPFFIYTSNVRPLPPFVNQFEERELNFAALFQVDAHFHRDFHRNEIYELHGSVERWQCAGDAETGAREPCEELWELPTDYRFALDVATMRAPGEPATTCRNCGGKGRPNVLMFHDKQWIANITEEMLEEDPSLNLVVLEIGCGTRTEMVVADVVQGCGHPQASLIRINPDFPQCDNAVILANGLLLAIPSRGLEALEGIDQELRNLQQTAA
ncbi:hypothetical protein BBJ28_00011499 [Nothophytophthora sp. Chile5]|nr:hypothetical protein BBJ28_00011499 [Nothophytophthora sp. Chile5]